MFERVYAGVGVSGVRVFSKLILYTSIILVWLDFIIDFSFPHLGLDPTKGLLLLCIPVCFSQGDRTIHFEMSVSVNVTVSSEALTPALHISRWEWEAPGTCKEYRTFQEFNLWVGLHENESDCFLRVIIEKVQLKGSWIFIIPWCKRSSKNDWNSTPSV